MSWGSARDRDERRKVALEALNRRIKPAELAVQEAKRKLLNANAPDKAAAAKVVHGKELELGRIMGEKASVEANMGKGTCAMNKRTRKTKTGDSPK